MILFVSLIIVFFLFFVFLFLPFKIVLQGNSLQAEISLYCLNLSLFKVILYHKPISFETSFFKKKSVFTSQELFEKIYSLFSKKKRKKKLEAFKKWCHRGPRDAFVKQLECQKIAFEEVKGFETIG